VDRIAIEVASGGASSALQLVVTVGAKLLLDYHGNKAIHVAIRLAANLKSVGDVAGAAVWCELAYTVADYQHSEGSSYLLVLDR